MDIREYVERQIRRENKYTVRCLTALRRVYSRAGRMYRREARVEVDSAVIEEFLTSMYDDILGSEYEDAHKLYIKPLDGYYYSEKKSIVSSVAKALGVDKAYATARKLLSLMARVLVPKTSRSISREVKKKIDVLVEQAENAGYSRAETARAIELLGTDDSVASYARTVARTETSAAANYARKMVIEDSRYVFEKIWDGILDDRIRRSHSLMSGIGYVPMDYVYHVPSRSGFDLMSEPHDENGSPENVVNCRCVLTFRPVFGVDGFPVIKKGR